MKKKVLIGISLAVMGSITVFWSTAKAELSLADENVEAMLTNEGTHGSYQTMSYQCTMWGIRLSCTSQQLPEPCTYHCGGRVEEIQEE